MNQAPQISFNKERDDFHVEKKWDIRETVGVKRSTDI